MKIALVIVISSLLSFSAQAAGDQEIFGWKFGSTVTDNLLPQLDGEYPGSTDIRDVFMSLPKRYFEIPYYVIGWHMTENKKAPYGRTEPGISIRLPGDGAQTGMELEIVSWDKSKGFVIRVTEEVFPGFPWTRTTTFKRQGLGWKILKIVKIPAVPVE